ncbi:MAG: hypothetical protein QOJ16_4732 [Acidobacteriota bacterium]|nr:hypothetical protein [Acidobacteriota bacterium]
MKKKVRKLTLSKETLLRMDSMWMAAAGGATTTIPCSYLSCVSNCGDVTVCQYCGPDDTGYCTNPPWAYC